VKYSDMSNCIAQIHQMTYISLNCQVEWVPYSIKTTRHILWDPSIPGCFARESARCSRLAESRIGDWLVTPKAHDEFLELPFIISLVYECVINLHYAAGSDFFFFGTVCNFQCLT